MKDGSGNIMEIKRSDGLSFGKSEIKDMIEELKKKYENIVEVKVVDNDYVNLAKSLSGKIE
ncbi:MAG: hypothetical protein PHP92_03245 [Candidatus Nanoarchaeia archaeon]|nr:hypothetical protein [Candidatus Nanoarchaeia archaeon]